ncbi:MAG: trypsin-like peptidase domain-containing protein [Roseococcus sp.]|jgi:S1-C subfamily serine protease
MPAAAYRQSGLGALLLLTLLVLGACAASPAQQAVGTPAGRVAAESLASLEAHGVPVGAAVAVGEGRLLTNAHVLRQAGGELRLRRGDDGESAPARVVAVSPRLDLAVLEAPPGFLRPAALAEGGVRSGQPVWALGPHGLGRAMAAGRVAQPEVVLRRFGPGYTAGLGALMGFSGGPVVDESGRVTGLTTALPEPGAAPALAMLTGVDLAGLMDGNRRQVFVLSIRAAMEEAARLGALPAAGTLSLAPSSAPDPRGRG